MKRFHPAELEIHDEDLVNVLFDLADLMLTPPVALQAIRLKVRRRLH